MGFSSLPANAASVSPWTSKNNNTHRLWYRDPGMRRLGFWIFVYYLSMISVGYDGALLTGLQVMPYWIKYFNNPEGGYLGIMSAAQSLGGLVAPPCGSWIADRFGRRLPVFIGATLTVVGTIVQATANSPNVFIGSRVLVGFGNVLNYTISPVLIAEIAHPRQRGPAATIFNQLYYLGGILAAWTTFGTLRILSDWSWRLPILIQGVGGITQMFLVLFSPESPRYHVAKGQIERARRTLARYHANGDLDDELVEFQLSEILAAHQDTIERKYTSSWRSCLETPGNRKRTFICIIVGFGSQWNGYAITAYFLPQILKRVGITNATQQAGLNGGLSIWSFLIGLCGCLLVDRLGRRTVWLMAYSWMSFCYIFIIALSATYAKSMNKNVGGAVVGFLFLHYAGAAWSTGLNIAYPCEIMPYHLRSKGLAIILVAAYIALTANQYVNPLALDAISWKYYFVYLAILIALVIVIYFYFPETRGCTIEEVAIIFDGADSTHVLQVVEAEKSEGGLTSGELENGKKESNGTTTRAVSVLASQTSKS